MTETAVSGNGTIAPLRNVALFHELIQRVQTRRGHLPSIGLFYGFSGYGKTFASVYGANVTRATYLEAGESWTKKKFLENLAAELGLSSRGTGPDLVERIKYHLAISPRPIVIDEFDVVYRRGYHETVRELHDHTHAPIVCIGEELLPHKLANTERFHNRILDATPAQPAGVDDARHLASLYAPEITIADNLLADIVHQSDGRARRICVNIEYARELAQLDGLATVDRAAWGERAFHTGQPPARRR